jgi:hypothetical protein
MTPEEFLETHELTKELQHRGATLAQLSHCRFWGTNQNDQFDAWSFTWPEDLPPSALSLVKPFCALRWLVLDDPSSSRDKDDAWRLVSDVLRSLHDVHMEPIIETGKAFTGEHPRLAAPPFRESSSSERRCLLTEDHGTIEATQGGRT